MQEKYRDFDRLDPRLFKAFHAAAVSSNFTQAARQAAMTQSGVSQQISKLEEQLGTPLFKRLPKQVVLTEAGRRLARFVELYLDEIGTLMADVRSLGTELAGRVAYAMPESCLLSRHLDDLLVRCQKHPGIELDVRIEPNDAVLELILNGTVDFGFVTCEPTHVALERRFFCQEELILIGADAGRLRDVNEASLEKLPFVTFPGMDVLFDLWREHHFPRASRMTFDTLHVAARITSLSGAARFVEKNIALSVVPRHCVEASLERGTLHAFQGHGDAAPLRSDIFLATLANERRTHRVDAVIQWFFDMVQIATRPASEPTARATSI